MADEARQGDLAWVILFQLPELCGLEGKVEQPGVQEALGFIVVVALAHDAVELPAAAEFLARLLVCAAGSDS